MTTNLTSVTTLSRDVRNGTVYAGGGVVDGESPQQIFALRVDKAIQDQRDLIVESQLMQDFDDRPVGQDTYTGVAPGSGPLAFSLVSAILILMTEEVLVSV
jgi:hypothetical protein